MQERKCALLTYFFWAEDYRRTRLTLEHIHSLERRPIDQNRIRR